MKVATTPNTASGTATISINGDKYLVRFGMNVMRDFTKFTGKAPSEFGQLLSEDYNEALSSLVYCAVKRYVPADKLPDFDQDAAADLIDGFTPEEADEVAEAITESVTTGNALLTSLTAKVASKTSAVRQSTPAANGTNI